MQHTNEGRSPSESKYRELPTQEQNGNYSIVDDNPDDEAGVRAQCGLGGLRCRILQVLAHPNAYVLCAGLLFVSTVGASGIYVAGVVSTIEKRFQLRSSESGLLMSMNDISSLCGVLFVTHFGGRSHRPRIVGISGLVVALGSFLAALPQFIFDNPTLDELFVNSANQSEGTSGASLYEKDLLCNAKANASPCTVEEIEASGSQFAKTWPIILGQLLSGLGGAAILPLSVTYIDDAVEKTILPIYMALMFLPMAIAPLFGFSISGYCLSLFVDFYKADTSELGISPPDPRWQGAWWLGFIIYGVILCLVSFPFFFFPRKMDKPKSYCCCTGMPDCCKGWIVRARGGRAAMTEIATHQKKLSGKPVMVIKEFLASLRRLLFNPTYMFSLLGYCLLVISFSGFGIFSAKYIQYEFGISPSTAGLLLGFTVMPGSLIGILLGGVLTSRMAGSQRGYAQLTLGIHVLCVLSYCIMLFFGCPNIKIAGLTTQYGTNGAANGNGLDVFSTCNMECSCERGTYAPVCGSDNVTYVTACFAGCKTVFEEQHNTTIYEGCACINQTAYSYTNESTFDVASKGACASNCDLLIPFVIFLCLATGISSLSFNPTFMMKFRSVLDKDRDLSLGLSSFLSKVLGFIPAPVLLGAIIDTQCLYWQESCDVTGECFLYDRPGLKFAFIGFTAGFRFLAWVFFCISSVFIFKQMKYEPANDKDGRATQNGEDVNDGANNGLKKMSSKEADV